MSTYDSTADTLLHIKSVNAKLLKMCSLLMERATHHDTSKLKSPEKELFDEYTPILKELKYGSDEYRESLAKLKPALDHHYFCNSHHPEHYGTKGISGMSLIDINEMFCDWWAATERTKGGDIVKSIDINKDRFNIPDMLVSVFKNTAYMMSLKDQNKYPYEDEN